MEKGLRSRPHGAERPRHPGVHRPRARPDDPPHTLKPGLVVHSAYNGYWLWGRPSVDDLRHVLRAVTREIGPDWDLSAPGLRDAWNAEGLLRLANLATLPLLDQPASRISRILLG